MKTILSRLLARWRAHQIRRVALVGARFRAGVRAAVRVSPAGTAEIILADDIEFHGVIVAAPGAQVRIGHHSTVRFNSRIEAAECIDIGEYAIISNNVLISDNNSHPTDPEARIRMLESGFYGELWEWKHAEHRPIRVGRNVWIGHHATILKGTTIGEGAIIAAHAVVTKDVPAFAVAAGNPARVVKRLREAGPE